MVVGESGVTVEDHLAWLVRLSRSDCISSRGVLHCDDMPTSWSWSPAPTHPTPEKAFGTGSSLPVGGREIGLPPRPIQSQQAMRRPEIITAATRRRPPPRLPARARRPAGGNVYGPPSATVAGRLEKDHRCRRTWKVARLADGAPR